MFLRYQLLDVKSKNAGNFSSPSSKDTFEAYFCLSYGWKKTYTRATQLDTLEILAVGQQSYIDKDSMSNMIQ